MKYLTNEEREFVSKIKKVTDWGSTTSDEIHRLSGAYCWEIYDKWNGENLDWVPGFYPEQPMPLL